MLSGWTSLTHRQLPGQINSAVIGTLFFECSKPWHALARSHLKRQHDIVSDFLINVLRHLADEVSSRQSYGYWMSEKLETLYEAAKAELNKVLAVYT